MAKNFLFPMRTFVANQRKTMNKHDRELKYQFRLEQLRASMFSKRLWQKAGCGL
jgi:hypothetical protein